MTVDNPRGYAFVSLSRSYERMHSWNWGAAMQSGGMMPDKVDFIQWGLDMWDRMGLDGAEMDEIKPAVDEMCKLLIGSVREQGKGALHYGRTETGFYATAWLEPEDFTLPRWRAEASDVDPYAAVENERMLASVVKGLGPRLTETEARLLDAKVSALPLELDNAELAVLVGVHQKYVSRLWCRIRDKAVGAFGENFLEKSVR